MNIEEFRSYCLSKPKASESFPFDNSTLVFKVMDKMFALTSLDKLDFTVNLKCDPAYAQDLREQYQSVAPGYHMNKKHWNTIYLDRNEISGTLINELIDHSYNLVVAKLPVKIKQELGIN